MHDSSYEIETLNGLIKTTIDSIDGYRDAAEDAESSQYQTIFFQRADERAEVADRLQDYVRQLGGTPTDSGSLAAGTHRAFMGLRDAVTGADDTAIIEEVERGEDHIKERFEAALTDEDLSAETLSVVHNCYESVRQGHDQMRNLKHGLKQSPSDASSY